MNNNKQQYQQGGENDGWFSSFFNDEEAEKKFSNTLNRAKETDSQIQDLLMKYKNHLQPILDEPKYKGKFILTAKSINDSQGNQVYPLLSIDKNTNLDKTMPDYEVRMFLDSYLDKKKDNTSQSFKYGGKLEESWIKEYTIDGNKAKFFGNFKGNTSVKFNRIAMIASRYNEIVKDLDEIIKDETDSTNNFKDIQTSQVYNLSVAFKLILQTGIRIGNESSAEGFMSSYKTKGKEVLAKTYGLTTLLPEHITFKGSIAYLDFTGKKHVENNFILSHKLSKLVRPIYDSNFDTVFNIDEYTLTKFIKDVTSPYFSSKDFRTFRANVYANEVAKRIDKPNTKKEYREAVREVAEYVSEKLNNTVGVVKSSYIDPLLFWYYFGKPEELPSKLTEKKAKGGRVELDNIKEDTMENKDDGIDQLISFLKNGGDINTIGYKQGGKKLKDRYIHKYQKGSKISFRNYPYPKNKTPKSEIEKLKEEKEWLQTNNYQNPNLSKDAVKENLDNVKNYWGFGLDYLKNTERGTEKQPYQRWEPTVEGEQLKWNNQNKTTGFRDISGFSGSDKITPYKGTDIVAGVKLTPEQKYEVEDAFNTGTMPIKGNFIQTINSFRTTNSEGVPVIRFKYKDQTHDITYTSEQDKAGADWLAKNKPIKIDSNKKKAVSKVTKSGKTSKSVDMSSLDSVSKAGRTYKVDPNTNKVYTEKGQLITDKTFVKNILADYIPESLDKDIKVAMDIDVDKDINSALSKNLKRINTMSDNLPETEPVKITSIPEDEMSEEGVEEIKGLGLTRAKMKLKDFFTRTKEEKEERRLRKRSRKENKSVSINRTGGKSVDWNKSGGIVDLATFLKDGGSVSSLMYQDGGSIIQTIKDNYESIKTNLNPNNWNVEDYSNEDSFTKAYKKAKLEGQEEFMYNNTRYSTKYAGTPRQEVGSYGVNEQEKY